MYLFLFKQKTAYEVRISDWSSDVCSSDLSSNALASLSRPALRVSPCGPVAASKRLDGENPRLRRFSLPRTRRATSRSAQSMGPDPRPKRVRLRRDRKSVV